VARERLPAAPPGAGPAGRRLWRSVVERFDLDEHEAALLREAARCVDLLDELVAVVRRDGPTIRNAKGDMVTHPAAVEARQTRLTLTRLLASLRLPEEDGGRAQRRGAARGAYAGRGRYLRAAGRP